MKIIVKNFVKETCLTLPHSLVSSASALVISRYVRVGLNLLKAMIAARLLGPNDYGIAALAIAYPTLIFSFVSVKSSSVTTRYISSFRALGHNEKIGGICKLGYTLDFITSVVGFLLIVTTSWWIAHFIYKIPYLSWLMIMYGASFPFYSLTMTSSSIFSSFRQFRLLASLEVLGAFMDLLIVVILLWIGLGVTAFILGTALGHAIIGVVMIGVATHLLSRHGINKWWHAPLNSVASLKGELTAFWSWNYLMVTLSGLTTQVPLMLIGRICGPIEAGFYRLALNLTVIGSYLETSLGQVVYPSLSECWAVGDKENISRSLQQWTLKGGVILSALLLFTVPFLQLVIPFLFSPAYNPMVTGAQLMMVGEAISALFFWIHSFYYASGKIAFWTKMYGLYTVVIIGLGIIFINWKGFLGLAGLLALSKVVFSTSMAFFAFRDVKS